MKKVLFGVLLLVLVFSMVGCGGGGGGGIIWDDSITIINDSGIYQDVYFGGAYFAGLNPGEYAVWVDIEPGTYLVESYDVFGFFYGSGYITIYDYEDSVYTIW